MQVNQSFLCIAGLLAPAARWPVQSEEAALQQLKEQVHLVIRSWFETAQPAVHVQPTAQVKQSLESLFTLSAKGLPCWQRLFRLTPPTNV